jgi:OOP family OmpA-OmpF porin
LRLRFTCAALVAAVLVALPAQAAADAYARGFDAVPTKFSPTMDSLWAVEGAELRPVKSWQLQALFDLNIGILGLKIGDTKIGDLIPFRADLHLMGSYTLHPRIEVSADLPFTVGQIGNFRLLREQSFADQKDPNAVGLGDWRFIGRFQIFKQESFPIGLTGIAEVRLPIGDGFSFLGDLGVVFAPRIAIERTFGPVRLVGNIGWRFRTAAAQYLNLYVGQEFTTGLGAAVSLGALGKFTHNTLIAEVNLATSAEAPYTLQFADSLKSPFELLVGARSQLGNHWALQLSIGRGLGLVTGYGRETLRVMFGLRYEHIAVPDRDGDGIPDSVDQCPDVPEDFDGDQDEDGCPEPDKDTDGDGVPDKIDACVETPGPKEYDGCPDKDGDQIPDNVDKCPDDPGPAETEGCPVPQEDQVTLESDRIRIKGNILYETGQAVIQRQSYKMLDGVVKVLLDHKDVGPVQIEGHTDNRGGHEYNLDLSNRRAKAVENYLVNKGVDRKRLRSQGFSFDRPIATNDTPLGRAKNRRTDFRLIEADSDDAGGAKGKDSPAPK